MVSSHDMNSEHSVNIVPSSQKQREGRGGLLLRDGRREAKIQVRLRKIANPFRTTPAVISANQNPESYAPYVIEPKTEIRILTLLSPAASDPEALHGTLSIEKLEDNPPYEALSYVWGEALFTERLYLPTGYLVITPNLAVALRSLRYRNRPRRLWADAICINQQDDNEKGHQVNMMSQIYRKTTCALCWLGEERCSTLNCLNWLQD